MIHVVPRFFVTACYYYAPMFQAVQSTEPTRVLRLRRSFRLSVSASTPPAPSWAPGVTGAGLRVPEVGRVRDLLYRHSPVPAHDQSSVHSSCGGRTSGRGVELSRHPHRYPEVLVSDRNAPSSGGAATSGRCVVEGGVPVAQAAARSQFAPTATRWGARFAPAVEEPGSSVAAKAETVSRPLISVFAEGCSGAILKVWGQRKESTWTRTASGPSKVVTVRTEGGYRCEPFSRRSGWWPPLRWRCCS